MHEKNASEFQGFFERIMGEAFSDFTKVYPYGNQGDGGNDGYRPDEGIYYQVYAPRNPEEKQSKAAQKLKKDFENLKDKWNEISKVKIFYFVFNDKDSGVSIEIARALADLKKANPTIEFRLFLPRDLEDIFLNLKKETIQSLGFDVDSRNSFQICEEALEKLEAYLDKGNASYVLESLNSWKDIIYGQNDMGLALNWEILECRALQQLEQIENAKKKYENLCKRYPNDPRPFLYLAEITLNEEEYLENEKLIKEAERIDKDYWLLPLEKDLRDQRLGKKIVGTSFDEGNFPANPRIKSNYYRFYSVALQLEKDFKRAESFVEIALQLNPERIANYITKLGIVESQLFTHDNLDDQKRDAEKLLSEIDSTINIVSLWGELSPRHQVIFNLEKIKAFKFLEIYPEMERLAKESFELIVKFHFDTSIDHYLTGLLGSVELPPADFARLLEYLRKARKGISDELAKALAIQFELKNTLFSEGKYFFQDKNKENILGFIGNLENNEYDKVWDFVKDDQQFAISFAHSAKDLPGLRREIINKLPDGGNIQKDKLLLLINYDESKFDEAFEILKGIDLSKSRYFECKIILDIARQKKAWEFAIAVLEKLLAYEKEIPVVLQLKVELFNANLNLKRFPIAIDIGEKILANSEEVGLLDERNKESLLAQTVLARVARGEYQQAKDLFERYPEIPRTVEFKVGVEADVYLKNRDASKAVASIVEGMKILKAPTPEQYARLFITLGEIDNLTKFPLDSLPKFEAESFVKFKNQERWYFVGNGDSLDAIKINSTDERYRQFLDKKKEDEVVFEFKYSPSSKHVIESILSIEKYIFAQSAHYFNQLAAQGNLEAVKMVQIPMDGDKIDTKNIIALLEDDRKGRTEFFNMYCENAVPLAFLAISEGGLTGAVALIQNEGRGFIRFSSGETDDINKQKDVAEKIVKGEPFYIDGTSALVLSETGLLDEIQRYLPNLRVPQSVIAMLLKLMERFRPLPGPGGYLQYVRGKLRFSSPDPDQGEIIQRRFEASIGVLESKTKNIGIISTASKMDYFSEQKVPSELCDACILAQKEGIPVLTEDYLYLQANEIETGKKAPSYCSVFAVMRVLYDQGKISFEKYLGLFSFLTSYRFRFLPITTEDIRKAVFGDGPITMVQPERIRWFNFPLTLSVEYGVPLKMSFNVLKLFLVSIVADDSITPDIAERIFLEILSGFPTSQDKRALGKLFLMFCQEEINKFERTILLGNTVKKKIDRLSELTKIYSDDNKIWLPST